MDNSIQPKSRHDPAYMNIFFHLGGLLFDQCAFFATAEK
jgi:hypothetical protein